MRYLLAAVLDIQWIHRNIGTIEIQSEINVAFEMRPDVSEVGKIVAIVNFNLQSPETIIARTLSILKERVRVRKIGFQDIVFPTQDICSLANTIPALDSQL